MTTETRTDLPINFELQYVVASNTDQAYELLTVLEEYMARTIGYLEHDQCDYCDGWDMGHHRCECGNRRMSLDFAYDEPIEGTDLKKYFAYPMAH